MMVKNYVEKPKQITAIQLKENNIIEALSFIDKIDYSKRKNDKSLDKIKQKVLKNRFLAVSIDHEMQNLYFGDYALRDAFDRLFICKKEIFEMLYQEM